MSRSVRRWLLLIVIAGAVIVVDQAAKNAVLESVFMGQSFAPIPALVPYFQFTPSMNTGSAFGFLPQAGDIFLIMAGVIVIGLFIFYPRIDEKAWLTRIGIALVVGGALGNALDRLTHGAVVDFIHYQIPGVISNVSNLADHAIVIGVALILIDSWFIQEQPKKADAAPTGPPNDGKPPST
ncbi:MAG TPA: signal peptidase II [Candidatus Limnocylindrales bacterium]|nr:signal peptidase II [Candidatus Limnocylindrales bacterium]